MRFAVVLKSSERLLTRLDDGFTEQFPKIAWHEITGMRNILIHEHFDVSDMG